MVDAQPLFEHDVPRGTEKGVVETGRLKWPRAAGAVPGYALHVTDSASEDQPIIRNLFAQLDAHNFVT